ncbi:MAG: (S)-2-hydroxyglutarate dehydrogenase [Solirubrobacterales bacterium]|jgi:2-hydroxyglutarate dehydrogenase|nr:(S)-2-hydroxyglutarate dehydrogenase [Solirubrobacterales bacterium]
MAPHDCDIAVVGGGIVGLATARELLRRDPQLKLALFERRPALATEQTGQTSGVIHAGIYYEPGSLKAKLCIDGARRLYEYCEVHGIDARREGKLIVAAAPEELPRLDELERRGSANGVPGLRRLGPDEIAEIEPHARGLAALHSPETGVVDFRAVAAALAGDVRRAGGGIFTAGEVKALIPRGKRLELVHDLGLTRARVVVGCAGAGSDKLAIAAGAPAEPRIVPFRGAYLRLRDEKADLVRASVYPVPDPALPFLGAHLTRTFDGRVLLGPTALMTGGFAWPGAWRLALKHRRAAVRELHHALSRGSYVAEAARLVPGLRPEDFEPGPSGVRAQAMNRDGTLVDDFVIHETERALHVRNTPSPAATSALALARLIADRVEVG